jgi:protocatechuate 3,4-dioxygenase beta subunit
MEIRTEQDPKDAITEQVIASFGNASNPRTSQLYQGLVKHLHAFINDVKPTNDEWMTAIQFLTAVGKKCNDKRQEFILLSDVFGVSGLVDIVNFGSDDPRATEPTVLGPFHVDHDNFYDNGASIVHRPLDTDVPTKVFGKVLDVHGNPIVGAVVDVWETDSNGKYDIQEDPDGLMGNLRGKFTADESGRYSFNTIRPVSYQVPGDGPVGELLRSAGRHNWRAAHIHAIVTADGFNRIVTHIFDSACPYIKGDAVFGVKKSLIRDFQQLEDGSMQVEFDFVLTKKR